MVALEVFAADSNRFRREFGGVWSPIEMRRSSSSAVSTPTRLCEEVGGANNSGEGSRVSRSLGPRWGTTEEDLRAVLTGV